MKNNIKDLMEKANITVSEISKETNIGRTTISTLINKPQIPESTKIGTLQKISTCLNVDIKDLFSEKFNWKILKIIDENGNEVDELKEKYKYQRLMFLINVFNNNVNFIFAFFADAHFKLSKVDKKNFTNEMDLLRSQKEKDIQKELKKYKNNDILVDLEGPEAIDARYPEIGKKYAELEEKLMDSYTSKKADFLDDIVFYEFVPSEKSYSILNSSGPYFYKELERYKKDVRFNILNYLNKSDFKKISEYIYENIIKNVTSYNQKDVKFHWVFCNDQSYIINNNSFKDSSKKPENYPTPYYMSRLLYDKDRYFLFDMLF